MRKLAYVLIFIVGLACTFGFVQHLTAATTGRPLIEIMQFDKANSSHWTPDDQIDIKGVDHDHFVYNDDEHIDLNVYRDDVDLSNELNTLGKDELIAGMVRGSNLINAVFSVGETKIVDSHLERKGEISILSLQSRQELPDGMYEQIEKYYIASGQTLHAELRWKSDAKSKAIKQAKADFEDSSMSLITAKAKSK